MNKIWGFLFLLIGSIICEEHIPKAVDAGSENIHQKILDEATHSPPIDHKDKNDEILNKESNGDEATKIQRVIAEKDIPSVVSNPEDLVTGGTSPTLSSSYITLTMLIKSRSIDCYYYNATNSFEVDYQVLKGGNFDIALSIYDSNVKRVAFQKSSNDGSLKITVPPEMINKDYSICFDNHDSSRDVKKVFMMIDVSSANTVHTPEFAQLNKLDLMHTALANIYTSLIQMEHLQEKRRAVESIDRSIMERNYEYVTMWCIIQISVMIVVSAIQLILIRSLFDAKGGIGAKIWRKLHDLTGGRF